MIVAPRCPDAEAVLVVDIRWWIPDDESRMYLEVDRHVAAPVQVVWDVLADWERQSEWMLDAKQVEVVTPHRAGHGVTIHVPTSLLGIPVLDIMRVTGWDPPHRLEATHLGRVIRGVGAFELAPEGAGTRLTWWEEIDPPLGSLGEIGARAALPAIRAIFATSLRRLGRVAEEAAHDARDGADDVAGDTNEGAADPTTHAPPDH